MRSHIQPQVDEDEKAFLQLKAELQTARAAVLEMLSPELQALFDGFYSCQSRVEISDLLEKIAEELIAKADQNAYEEKLLGAHYAKCPLCRRGAGSSPFQAFVIPEGLRRHLLGHGNAHPCAVMETIRLWAREIANQKFSSLERELREIEQNEKSRRRQDEVLYVVSPFREAELIDERQCSGSETRGPDGLSWAESRLRLLGFNKMVEGNAISWIDDREQCVVYADPRYVGQIHFEVWTKPLPKKINSRSKSRYPLGRFFLLDSWVNDLIQKYEKRLFKVLRG